jgi:hypothetical protein
MFRAALTFRFHIFVKTGTCDRGVCDACRLRKLLATYPRVSEVESCVSYTSNDAMRGHVLVPSPRSLSDLASGEKPDATSTRLAPGSRRNSRRPVAIRLRNAPVRTFWFPTCPKAAGLTNLRHYVYTF